MIFSLIVIAAVAVIAYIWASRGFFSALLHMIAVVCAGAIAFACWEPLAYAMLDRVSARWLIDIAWAVCLAVPFAVSLVLIRVSLDKLIPGNADLDTVTNLIGGGLCGAISGTISIGILVLSVSMQRVPPEYIFYKPVDYEANGSLKRSSSLLFPVDRITAVLYSSLSTSTFLPVISGEPLADWHPDLDIEGPLLRTNFNEGRAFHTLKPNAFTYQSRYTVGLADRTAAKDLTKSIYGKDAAQAVVDTDGEPISPASSYIEGFVVKFKAAAKEQTGQVIIGNGQVRLVVDTVDGGVIGVQPFAMISQAKGDKSDYGRWRFETANTFIASVGGGADAPMAFEFLVPLQCTPRALYVKGVRIDLRDKSPGKDYRSALDRDLSIQSGDIMSSASSSAAPADLGLAPVITVGDGTDREAAVVVDNSLPSESIIKKGFENGLEIDEDNRILNGEQQFNNGSFAEKGGSMKLQIRKFAATEDTVVVKVDVGLRSVLSLVTNNAASNAPTNEPIYLIDSNNQRAPAIGFIYRDATTTNIRFTPSRPLSGIADLPQGGPSMSRPDQKFVLLFRVSRGETLNITGLSIGDKVVAKFKSPIRTNKAQA